MSNRHRPSLWMAGLDMLSRDVLELIAAWWRADRIRASPRCGRLLRIAPGSIVSVEGSLLEVIQREARETAQGPCVRYECRGADGRSELWIDVATERAIRWTRLGEEQSLAPEAIEVWPVRHRLP